MFKKFIKKAFKGIKKVLKNPGRALKKGLGKIGKAFGKLGPIGTLALTLMLPGLGAAWSTFGTWAQGLSGPLGAVMNGIRVAGNAVGSVYGKVTDLVSGTLNKVSGGSPHIIDVLNAKKIALVINTGGGKRAYRILDSTSLRRATLINKVPYCTNMSTAYACLEGIKSLKSKKINVKAIQEL